jgi:hypothetical protein
MIYILVFRSAVHGQETVKDVCRNVTVKISLAVRLTYFTGVKGKEIQFK